jgi:hypothetical protein
LFPQQNKAHSRKWMGFVFYARTRLI